MKHHKHISPATLTALLFLALLLLIEYPTRQSTLQHEISTQVLRFHIRANSDTPADQQKKLQLKQTLLTWLTPILSTAASKQETIKTIQQTLPEITKEANPLRIDIGAAKGHNWWCVLYPSLCYADTLDPTMTEEGEQKLQQVLDEDAYDLLLHPQKLKIRFRLEFFLRNR